MNKEQKEARTKLPIFADIMEGLADSWKNKKEQIEPCVIVAG